MNPKELLGETEYNEYKKAYESLSKEIPELQGFSIEYILSKAIENKLIEKRGGKEKLECETIRAEHARWSNLSVIFYRMAADAASKGDDEGAEIFERAARSASSKARQYYELYMKECKRAERKRMQKTRVCCGPYGSPYPNFAYFPITHSQTVTVSSSNEVIQVLIKKLHTGAWITIWMGKEGEINLSEGGLHVRSLFQRQYFRLDWKS